MLVFGFVSTAAEKDVCMKVLFGCIFLCWHLVSQGASVWDRTIVHPLSNGWHLANGRCSFGTTNCAGSGYHLGVDIMASASSPVQSMCDGTVKFNNTSYSTIWNSLVIVEHNCGGAYQKLYGYYGHISSSINAGTTVLAGDVLGSLKDDGGNSHLHMGLSYSYTTSNWGYQTFLSNDWLDYQWVLYRSNIKPTLETPNYVSTEASTAKVNVNFSWKPVGGASTYRYVISQDPNPLRNFDEKTKTCTEVRNGGKNCWTNANALSTTNISMALSPNVTYYWVVRSNNSDWSEIGVYKFDPQQGSAATPISDAIKYENLMNCTERLLPSYFPKGGESTQRWTEPDGSFSYVRLYANHLGQGVWNGIWLFYNGQQWVHIMDVNTLKTNYCPNAW